MEDKKIEHLTRKELIKKVKMMERDEEIKKLIKDKKLFSWAVGIANFSFAFSLLLNWSKNYEDVDFLICVALGYLGIDTLVAINVHGYNKEIKKLKYMDLDEDDYEYNVSYFDNDDFITMTEETKIPKDEEGILLDYYQYQKEQKNKKSQKTLDKK